MDVSVKVSLQGGHVWEFVCDDGDPMLAGLVSALPGAAVDANLPSDGLVQVEARNGERLYLTRSSLVAVVVRQLGRGGVPDGLPRGGTITPMPFALVPDCLDGEMLKTLLAMAERAGRQPVSEHLDDIDLKGLPKSLRQALVAAITDACRALELKVDAETHLDVTLHSSSHSGDAIRVPLREHDLLSFVLLLPTTAHSSGEANGLAARLRLHDRRESQPGQVDSGQPREVDLPPNCLMAARGAFELSVSSALASALLLRGSLVPGGAPEPA
jgi:hypothetical protein